MKRVLALCLLLFLIGGAPAFARTYEGSVEFDAQVEPDEPGVLVQWDKWRNRIVHAAWRNWGKRLEGGVSLGIIKMGMHGSRQVQQFADGTYATFRCLITRGKHVKDVEVIASSGDEKFDQLVLASVESLDGSSILAFPTQSRRDSVEQVCTFRLGPKTQFEEQQTGDNEKVRP